MKVVIIDNYDSFSYILYDYLCQTGSEVSVIRNDADIVIIDKEYKPDKILISPGPGHPADAGNSAEVIKRYGGKIPLLGVCLGHQVMGMLHGFEIKKSMNPKHGKVSMIKNNGEGVFRSLPREFEVMRYHSLYIHAIKPSEGFTITAISDDGIIMGIRNKKLRMEGVQFHPESVLTRYGKDMILNWIKEGV